ncbi:3 beta-hydroxysteroid dehydrogenase/Delta 5--_4-isomerase, partial [Fragariocoptes setiger]
QKFKILKRLVLLVAQLTRQSYVLIWAYCYHITTRRRPARSDRQGKHNKRHISEIATMKQTQKELSCDKEPDSKKQVIVITGANGCIGRAVLKLLVARDSDSVSEIRCLDIDIFNQSRNSTHIGENENKIQINWIKGDVRDINIVERTLDGATSVIHCASITDITGLGHDFAFIESVNVDGTLNLLQCCIRQAVESFVYVSSLEACAGDDAIYYATESTTTMPKTHLFGASGSTKAKAEQLVRQFASTRLSKTMPDGRVSSLNAVILRLPPVYGPHDKYFISQVLAITDSLFGGRLRQLDHVWIRQQPIFIDNAAWAIICAKQRSLQDLSISGEEFYVTDDTPICDPFEFIEPFLKCRNMQLIRPTYPYIVMWLLLIIYRFLFGLARKVDLFNLIDTKRSSASDRHSNKTTTTACLQGEKLATNRSHSNIQWLNYVTPTMLTFICNTYFFNRTKASLRLNYSPIVDFNESQRFAIDWYTNNLDLSQVELKRL